MIKTIFIGIITIVTSATFFSGNIFLPINYSGNDTTILDRSAQYKAIKQQEKWALFKGTKQLTPYRYESISPPYNNGLFKVCTRYDSCGFINGHGKEIISTEYFIGGYAAFNKNGIIPASKANDGNLYFLHANGKVEKHIWDLNAAIQSTMTPTPFPRVLKKYGQMTDSLVFSKSNCFRCDGINKWTPEFILHRALRAFMQEPITYDLNPEVIQAYALPGGGGNYWTAITYSEGWKNFRDKAIFNMLKNEATRKIVWGWLKENYMSTYLLMNPYQREAFKDVARSLQTYFGPTYNPAKVEAFLKKNEASFAYTNPMATGKPMVGRKPAAFVERLVYVHKVISIGDARRWVNIVTNEVLSWP